MTAPVLCQQCTRCGTYWPVAMGGAGPVPARWCPRCQGDLSRPFPLPGQQGRQAPVQQSAHRPPPQRQPPQSPAPQSPAPQPQPQVPQHGHQPGRPRPVVTGTAAQRLQAEQQYSQDPHGRTPRSRPPDPSPHDPRQGAPRRRAALPRGYRWVARPPSGTRAARTEARGHGDASPGLGPTPRYRRMPRWGLHVEPPARDTERESKDRSAAASVRTVLTATIVLFALAALAEVFRYALMLRNRGHLVHQLTVAISDATALVFGYAAMVFVVVSAVVCARWLVRARARAYEAAGEREPRRPRWMYAGLLVPVVNLVYPGVYLSELALARCRAGIDGDAPDTARGPGLGTRRRRGDSATARAAEAARGAWSVVRAHYRGLRDGARLSTLVRFWWALWVLCNLTAAGVAMARLDPSVQARADNVVYTVYADLLALAAVVVTRIIVDRVEGRRATAEDEMPVRWVLDTAADRAGASAGAPR